jgi:hypothetical protein
MNRFPFLVVPVAIVGLVTMTLSVRALPSTAPVLPQQPAGRQMMGGQTPGMPTSHAQMTGMHEKMMADMKAMDVKLDALVTKMNRAQGAAKVDAIAETVTAMVSQHKTMHDGMMKMEGQMMMQMHSGAMPMGAK